jgi:hypothetical protein
MKDLYGITNSFALIQETLKPISALSQTMSPFFEAQKELNSMLKASTLGSSIALMQETLKPISTFSKLLDTKFENESLLQSRIIEITNQYNDKLEINEYIDILMNDEIKDINEKNIIDESFEILCEMSPDINILKSSIDSTKYRKIIITIIFILVFNSLNFYTIYNQLSNNDVHYKANRDNVRIRLTPTNKDNSNIITKLNKNTYVEKIGSNNGWINIKFELSDGIEKDGWIYRTMLTKIED